MLLKNIAKLLCASLLFAGALAATAATEEDSPGITVNQTGLLHRAPVKYPPQARSKGIEGDVVIEVVVSQKGLVTDARVVSGPEELRNAALASVLQWHFANGPARVSVTIGFKVFRTNPQLAPGASRTLPNPGSAANKDMGVLKTIQFDNLPQELRDALASRVPAHEGDLVTSDFIERTVKAALETDEHVQVRFQRDAGNGGATLRFTLADDASIAISEQRVKVGGNVQAAKIREMRRPKYPPEAKQAGVQGKVSLNAIIGKDGRVKSLTVMQGDPLLAAAATEAVKDWTYDPTLVGGEAVEVLTQIDVNFTLSK